MIGSDFTIESVRKHCVYCSECGRKLGLNEPALVSKRNGVVKKRVCGENCRLEFDARFWGQVARHRDQRFWA